MPNLPLIDFAPLLIVVPFIFFLLFGGLFRKGGR